MNSLFVTEEMKFSFGLHFSSESFISFCEYTKIFVLPQTTCKYDRHEVCCESKLLISIQYFLNSEKSTIHCCKTLVSGWGKILSLKSVN